MPKHASSRRRSMATRAPSTQNALGSARKLPALPTAGPTKRPRRTKHGRWAWMGVAGPAIGIGVLIALVLTRGGAAEHPVPALSEASLAGPTQGRADATSLQSIHRVSSTPLLDGGKPVVFFMGGQFCPFCAADRWSFVKATSRFGVWTGLHSLHSKPGTDGFGGIPTYDLTQATYKSDVLALQVREVADVNGNPLQSLTTGQQQLVNQFDPGGAIPFTLVGGFTGRYKADLAYSPAILEGQDFDSLRAAVDGDQATPAVQAINASADAFTALLCKLSGGLPAAVCATPYIQSLTAQVR